MAPKFKMAKTFDEYTTEKLDIVQNKLLGDYNANGIYVINKKISAELLDLKKIKKESYNNEIFCTAVTNSGRIIDFEIEFKKNSASKLAVAELSVLEGVPKQGGRMMNIIKTPIGKFTGEITPDFVDKALAKFKVVVNAADEGQDRKDVDDEYIVKRNMLLNYLDQMTQESYNIIYEDYFTQRINLLKQVNNSYTKKILAIFNDEFNKISDYFLLDKKTKKVTNYKAMNELLDKAFEDLSGLKEYEEQEKMFREKMLPILGIFVAGAERIDSSSKKTVLETVPKRFKEILTEPLLDKKQMEESRIPPTVKETNQEIINKEIKSAMEKIGDRSKKLSGEERTATAEAAPTKTTKSPAPTKEREKGEGNDPKLRNEENSLAQDFKKLIKEKEKVNNYKHPEEKTGERNFITYVSPENVYSSFDSHLPDNYDYDAKTGKRYVGDLADQYTQILNQSGDDIVAGGEYVTDKEKLKETSRENQAIINAAVKQEDKIKNQDQGKSPQELRTLGGNGTSFNK